MIDFAPYHIGPFGSTNGTIAGRVVLTPPQKSALVSGLTYVNVHSAAHGGGEIRGQIAPVLMQTSLSGTNERPNPVISTGSGSGIFTLVRDQLSFNITYRDLPSTATASHIHGPATALQSASVLIDFARVQRRRVRRVGRSGGNNVTRPFEPRIGDRWTDLLQFPHHQQSAGRNSRTDHALGAKMRQCRSAGERPSPAAMPHRR